MHGRGRFSHFHAGLFSRTAAALVGAVALVWPNLAFAAAPWSPISLGQLPIIALGAVIAYAIWMIVRTVREVRRITADESSGGSAWRRVVRALLLIAGVLAFVFVLMWRLGLPMAWPGYVFALAWFFAAIGLATVAENRLPGVAAATVALVATDILAAFAFGIAREYNYFPFVPTLVLFAAFTHITVFARREMLEKLGSPAAFALVSAIVIITPDAILSHASLRRLDVLDRPGIATRIPGTQGRIPSIFADPLTGYVFYVDREDRTKIHSISTDWGKRVFFQDRRERFERVMPAHKPGTMLATSSSPQGRSAFLMALPDMNVRANFAGEATEGGARQGPEAFFATLDERQYIASARTGDGYGLVRCQMPLDGSEPLANMGTNCTRVTDSLATPGPVILDGGIGYVYALEPGSLFRRESRVQLFNSSPATLLKALPMSFVATDMAVTPSGRTLYVAATSRRKILYLNARKLEPSFEVDVDLFPTRLLVDGAARFMYVGSYIDGQVQVVNIANGAVSRPIPVGPGLNDLSLDERRQFLYAATDVGVIRVDLSLVELPLDATKLDSSVGIRRIE